MALVLALTQGLSQSQTYCLLPLDDSLALSTIHCSVAALVLVLAPFCCSLVELELELELELRVAGRTSGRD